MPGKTSPRLEIFKLYSKNFLCFMRAIQVESNFRFTIKSYTRKFVPTFVATATKSQVQ